MADPVWPAAAVKVIVNIRKRLEYDNSVGYNGGSGVTAGGYK